MSPRETPSAPVPGELPRPARIMLGGALAVAAGLSVLALAAVVLRRVGHPLELNWMEGAMADHVTRVLAGHPLYVPPSIDFVPFLYPPLYYWASALIGLFAGEGFLALRLVSIFASIGLLALSYALVTRETGIVTSTSPFPNDISPLGPYRAAGDVTTDPLALWPVAGARRRPAQFYRPE